MSYITEAFKKLTVLNEEAFNVSTNDGIDDLAAFVDLDDEKEQEVEIIDPEAETEDELEDNYIGDIIIKCPVCNSLVYKGIDDIEFSPEDEDKAIEERVVNREEECPYCATMNGFTIVGKVMPFEEEDDVKVKVDGEEVDVEEKDDDEEINEPIEDSEEVKEEEIVEESLNERIYDDITVTVSNIDFDVTQEDLSEEDAAKIKANLPTEMTITLSSNDVDVNNEEEMNEAVAEAISEETGWLVNSFDYEFDTETIEESCKNCKNESLKNRIYFPKNEGKLSECGDKILTEDTDSTDEFQAMVDADMNDLGFISQDTRKAIRDAGLNISEVEDGKYIVEAFNNVQVDTEDQRLSMQQDDKGKVTVTTEPITDEMKINEFDGGDEMVAPLNGEDLLDLNVEADADVAAENAENNQGTEEPEEATESEEEGNPVEDFEAEEGEETAETGEEGGDESNPFADFESEEGGEEEEEGPGKNESLEGNKNNTALNESNEDEKPEKEMNEFLNNIASPNISLNLDASGQSVGFLGGTGGSVSNEELENNEVDVDIEELDEECFNELCEKYLRRVYENVKSFNATSVGSTKNGLIIEGNIGFRSGNTKKTTFVFEAKDATRGGRLRFIGENKEITRGKKSFVLTGKMNDNKLVCESLNYNYMQNRVRVNGTVKK